MYNALTRLGRAGHNIIIVTPRNRLSSKTRPSRVQVSVAVATKPLGNSAGCVLEGRGQNKKKGKEGSRDGVSERLGR